MTDEIPHRPPVRRVVVDTLSDAGSVTDDLLVATVHDEADAAPWMIRATIERMERAGVIYNASGDEMDPRWKLTNP